MTEKTFTFSNGTTVRLRRISQFMLSRLLVDNTGKFEVPQKLVTVGTRQNEKLIPDYDNQVYKELIEEQRNRDRGETLANLSVFAVVDDVPSDLYSFYKDLAVASRGNDVTDSFIKGLWILDMVESEKELSEFQEAILGINHITERGVEESQKKFPSTD